MPRGVTWFFAGLLCLPLLVACTNTTASHGTSPSLTATVLGSASAQGTTITVQTVRATALATLMTLTIAAPAGHAYTIDFDGAFLAANGHGYAPRGAISENGDLVSLEFPAFVDADLGHPISAALTITALAEIESSHSLAGPWRVPFQLSPVTPRTLTPEAMPVEHNGVSLQLTRVDWVTGAKGGVRVRLKVVKTPDQTTVNPGYFSEEILNAGVGNFALLNLPDHRSLKPHAINYRVDEVSGQNGQEFFVVGTFQGTVDFIYLTAPLPTGAQATLHLDRVPTQHQGDAQPETINGPWDFAIPA